MSGDTVPVDPDRLASGRWDHRLEKQVGEGDITASYSADRIGLGRPLRRPFRWRGGLWVCIGIGGSEDAPAATAYRLTPIEAFPDAATTYTVKTRDAAAARADPLGFYHGVVVSRGGSDHVLTGPPQVFIAGDVQQFSLFASRSRDR